MGIHIALLIHHVFCTTSTYNFLNILWVIISQLVKLLLKKLAQAYRYQPRRLGTKGVSHNSNTGKRVSYYREIIIVCHYMNEYTHDVHKAEKSPVMLSYLLTTSSYIDNVLRKCTCVVCVSCHSQNTTLTFHHTPPSTSNIQQQSAEGSPPTTSNCVCC